MSECLGRNAGAIGNKEYRTFGCRKMGRDNVAHGNVDRKSEVSIVQGKIRAAPVECAANENRAFPYKNTKIARMRRRTYRFLIKPEVVMSNAAKQGISPEATYVASFENLR